MVQFGCWMSVFDLGRDGRLCTIFMVFWILGPSLFFTSDYSLFSLLVSSLRLLATILLDLPIFALILKCFFSVHAKVF